MLRYIAAVCLLIVPALGVGLGSNCTNNGDCDVTNSMCMKYTTCDMGMCKCKTGYMMTNATTCKEMKAYDEACDDGTSCTGGTTCTPLSGAMRKCKCPTDGMPWSPKLKMCSNKKAKGEVCTNAIDCYGEPVSTSCTVMDGSTDKTCMCKAGYMAGTGMYMYMCTVQVTETNYADGKMCTMNSDCDSYKCAMCPGAGTKTCLSMRTSNAATTTRGAICMMLIGVIVSRFF